MIVEGQFGVVSSAKAKSVKLQRQATWRASSSDTPGLSNSHVNPATATAPFFIVSMGRRHDVNLSHQLLMSYMCSTESMLRFGCEVNFSWRQSKEGNWSVDGR